MDDSASGTPLPTAGLVTALFSSMIASSQASVQYNLSSLTGQNDTLVPGSGSNDGDNGTMREWSSLIGIVTALVGNVLISLALNIQRYAHIRIAREWEHEKSVKESRLRRVNELDVYGTTTGEGGEDDYRGRRQDQGYDFNPYRDESLDSGYSNRRYRDHDRDDGSEAHEDRLHHSISSEHTLRPAGQDSQMGPRKSYLRSPYWWVGIVLMTLGEAGNFLAYGFAPASIVSPLGVVALISNCVIAPCMLKEKFRTQDLWGVLIAIAGAVVVVLSAKSSEEKIGPDDIWAMITQWEFELYLVLVTVLIIALMSVSNRYGSRSILIDVGLVALFGGLTALSTKGVSSLLSFTLWHAITFPITYLLAFVLAFSALMQIRYINRALQRFDSTQVIPTQFVLFTLSVIIGSAILYRDFEKTSASRAGKFVGGCIMTFVGVYFITSGRVRPDDDSDFSIIEDDEEEAIGLLAGDQLRSSTDLYRPEHQKQQRPVYEPVQKHHERPYHDTLPSPRASLLSVGIDDIDNQPTPRGVLSPSVSSPAGSVASEPLSAPSERRYVEQPHSLTQNPWATLPAEQHPADSHFVTELQVDRPATPTEQPTPTPPASTVLLRFPAAPGLDDTQHNEVSTDQQEPVPPDTNRPQPSTQNVQLPQTPPPRSRNSISVRFSPGRFLPTISTGFSAVVAESLRRGETSPVYKRSRSRRKRSDAVVPTTESHAAEVSGRPEPGPGPEYDTDASADDNERGCSSLSLTADRLLHSPTVKSAPITAPATATVFTPVTKDDSDKVPESTAVITRLRSLSDSWNGSLGWLGGTLRRGSKQESQNISAAEDDNGNATTATGPESATEARDEEDGDRTRSS